MFLLLKLLTLKLRIPQIFFHDCLKFKFQRDWKLNPETTISRQTKYVVL